MSEVQRADAEVPNDTGPDELDLTNQDSQATVVSKRADSGRKGYGAWDTSTTVANPDPGKSKRAWVGVCNFYQEKVVGKTASL